MSLKRYLEEIGSIASEVGLYTPLATHIFGALLGYPPKHRVITKRGEQGTPDIRLSSQDDGSEWVVAEVKFDDKDIRDPGRRKRIWEEQILARGYIGPDTFYVTLCGPRTFYVCDLAGNVLTAVHVEQDCLLDALSGTRLPLAGPALRDLLHRINYASSLGRPQFEAFRAGAIPAGRIQLGPETLPQLQDVFHSAIEDLTRYCRARFELLRDEHAEARVKVEQIQQRLADIGSGATKTRDKLIYQRETFRARHRLALQIFESDYDRFRHDQTYSGTEGEEHFQEIFCTNTAYVALSRLFFVRICEDLGLTTRKISNSGVAVWREFVANIKERYQDLIDVAFKDVAHVYSSLFEASVFDWFGKQNAGSANGELHRTLERILFRLNSFNFRQIDRDLLGSIYQYFRPRIERRRLGEYYTPVEVVDYILARTGIASDPDIMQKRILDPACGSFTFGVRAIGHLLRAGAGLSPQNRIDLVRTCLAGRDINPFSVFLAHLSLLFALLDVYMEAKKAQPGYEMGPMDVAARNSLTVEVPAPADFGALPEFEKLDAERPVDYVVGNPPFVRRERLPEQDRQVLDELFGPLTQRNTDLSVYFLYKSLRDFAKDNGTVGMVAPIGVANTNMAGFFRNTLRDYELYELVSLEWCAKQVFPGADIIPMLVFVRNTKQSAGHHIRLLRNITTIEELKECTKDESLLQSKLSVLPFNEWAALSPTDDWCLDVTERDLPVLAKLNRADRLRSAVDAPFGVKAGRGARFLRLAEGKAREQGEVPFSKGQHVAAFHLAADTEEYAALTKLASAEDPSIWSDLEFYRANAGRADDTGMGRTDYRTPQRLGLGSPSDTLCCLVPEIYVTLVAAVADPLTVVANNSAIVVVPRKFSAHCIAAIINSRISRYYAFLTLRSAILLRRRTTWFPRAIKALPLPRLSPRRARRLHDLSAEATALSASIPGSEADVYTVGVAGVKEWTKAGFLGLQVKCDADSIDRQDLAAASVRGGEMVAGTASIRAKSPDTLVLLRAALLATEDEEFSANDIQSVEVPADPALRTTLARKIRDFTIDVKKAQDRVLLIVEEIDAVVAEGLGLETSEYDIIRRRCSEFPLSVTVERPRFAWSADRKRQARRVYVTPDRFR
jgi:hypothetical protein